MDKFSCVDCGACSSEFMVHDEIWRKAKLTSQVICLNCLEKRIGRTLNLEDFQIGLPINDNIFYAVYSIGKQLGGNIEKNVCWLWNKHLEIKKKRSEFLEERKFYESNEVLRKGREAWNSHLI